MLVERAGAGQEPEDQIVAERKRAKAPKRISILASDAVAALPELQELAEKGHVVNTFSQLDDPEVGTPGVADYDLILSDSACAFVPVGS